MPGSLSPFGIQVGCMSLCPHQSLSAVPCFSLLPAHLARAPPASAHLAGLSPGRPLAPTGCKLSLHSLATHPAQEGVDEWWVLDSFTDSEVAFPAKIMKTRILEDCIIESEAWQRLWWPWGTWFHLESRVDPCIQGCLVKERNPCPCFLLAPSCLSSLLHLTTASWLLEVKGHSPV